MDQEAIGKFIKELRTSNNMTQKEFADKLGVTYQAVSKWELGKNIPDIETLKIISEMFNVDINELINGKKINKDIKNNKMYIKYIIGLAILIIVGLFLMYYKKDDSKVKFKELKSACSEFKITGIAAYDTSKSSLRITSIDYCEDKNEVYEKISCALYEEYGNTKTKVATCTEGNNKTLKEYLSTVKIKVDNYKQVCNEFSNVSMYLEINASNGETMDYIHKVPLTVEDDCN